MYLNCATRGVGLCVGWGGLVITLLLSPVALAQSTVTLTTSFFTQGERAGASASGTDSLQLGNATRLGYQYLGGPHRLTSGYRLNLQRTVVSGDDVSTSWSGDTRYLYSPQHRRFDVSLGHAVRAVAEEESFLIDPASYSLRHTLSAGGGLNATPTARTRLELAARGSQLLDEALNPKGRSLTVSAVAGFQQAPARSTSLTVSRRVEWNDDGQYLNTIDSAEVGYARDLFQGRFSAGVGLSEFAADTVTQVAVTGNLTRTWENDLRQITFQYSRSFSNTLRELELEVAVVPDDDPENTEAVDTATQVVQLESAMLRDALSLSGQTDYFCRRCSVQGSLSIATPEDVFTGDRMFNYGAGAAVNLRHSNLQSSQLGYQWRAEAEVLGDRLRSSQHRLNAGLEQQLSERAAAEVTVEHSWRWGDERYRTLIRLGINYGLLNHQY